jgi:hypothetical protein
MTKGLLVFLDYFVKYFVPVSGGLLGYLTFVSAQRQKKRRAQEEVKDWQLYAEIVAASKEGLVFKAEPGSDEFKRADRLRQKGLLEHAPGSEGFSVPGQRFAVMVG